MNLGRLCATSLAAVLFVVLVACRREPAPEPARKRLDPLLQAAVVRHYADIAFAAYGDAVSRARELATTIDAFVQSPSEAGLTRARRAWLDARPSYLQTEVFRFYDGPIDRVEGLVNPWPMDESYIDSIIDDAQRYPDLSSQLLTELNVKDGEKNISTGYHAVEYLLWGRDDDRDGPGRRPVADFVDVPGAAQTPARRRAYLKIVTALLVQHLNEVQHAWDPANPKSYRAELLAAPPDEAIGRIIKGMGTLAGPELAGERLTVPYETKDQENEHSCFSDSTHLDVLYDALGAENLCLGRYQRLDGTTLSGPGVCALVAEVDDPLARALTRQLAQSVAAARALPAPFDRAILGADEDAGRRAVKATITALQAATDSLARASSLLGLRVSLALPGGA